MDKKNPDTGSKKSGASGQSGGKAKRHSKSDAKPVTIDLEAKQVPDKKPNTTANADDTSSTKKTASATDSKATKPYGVICKKRTVIDRRILIY